MTRLHITAPTLVSFVSGLALCTLGCNYEGPGAESDTHVAASDSDTHGESDSDTHGAYAADSDSDTH